MTRRLCLIFFLSGAAALVFENLWFRQAGLAFGSSVWATSLVLSSFMGGLALGNALATRWAESLRRPIRTYAGNEIVVAASGLFLVIVLPHVGDALLPLFRGFFERPVYLNFGRLIASFVLLAVPSTAMGLGLPLLTKALAPARGFGESLGALYGWNTLGAVAGTLAVETILVERLGVRGTGVAAASLGAVAAVLAFTLSRGHEGGLEPAAVTPAERPTPEPDRLIAGRLLAAGFSSGALLLALEVVWFRFLLLYCSGTSLSLAVLLATILAGIGLGSLAASAWLKRSPLAHHSLPLLFMASAMTVIGLYAGFGSLLRRLGGAHFADAPTVAVMASFLTLPVSFLSGLIFSLLGAALHERLRGAARTAGALTLVNTLGAMLGALAGGFLLLPLLGMERSFALLAAGYGVAALVVPWTVERSSLRRLLTYGAGALCLLFLALFPFGLMRTLYLLWPLTRYHGGKDLYVIAVREGLSETVVYAEQREHDERVCLRLITNGFSMSGTSWDARRYMGLYVYLPVALHPKPRHALLVSFGVGTTAQALTRTAELESIDVVDISRDILDLSSVVFPEPGTNPLQDPRVRVHVEDGRAFLKASDRRFDLITSEPPPPRNAGVVNLYSQEYFELLGQHLTQGGFVTYWLPAHALGDQGSRAVVRAFCNVFADCSLWHGANLDWMLVGTNNFSGPVSAERVRRQWRDPVVGAELRFVGLASPEEMGALFLADAEGLARYAATTEPITDNWPSRVGREVERVPAAEVLALSKVLDAEAGRSAFASSLLLERLWPPALRDGVLAAFPAQGTEYDRFKATTMGGPPVPLERLHEIVTRSSSRLPVLLLLGSNPDLERIAKRKAASAQADAWVHRHLAISALADRDFPRAAEEAQAAAAGDESSDARLLRDYTHCLRGHPEGSTLLPGLAPRSQSLLATLCP